MQLNYGSLTLDYSITFAKTTNLIFNLTFLYKKKSQIYYYIHTHIDI